MFTTKEQFEGSSLYKRYGTMPVEAVEGGYHCYATVEAENGQLVNVDDTVAIAIQVNDGGLITLFRASGSEEDMTKMQKIRIFEFACDHIYGNGRSNNKGYFDKFVKQFVEKNLCWSNCQSISIGWVQRRLFAKCTRRLQRN